MNNVNLIGNLTRDPNLITSQGGMSICKFTLALNRYKKSGEEQQADFINIVTFGKTADNCSKFLSKGKKVGVNGSLQSGSYENKEGRQVYTVDVIAQNVEFLDFGGKKEQDSTNDFPAPEGFQPTNDDSVPF